MDSVYYPLQKLLYKLVKGSLVFESSQVEIDEMVIELEVATSQDWKTLKFRSTLIQKASNTSNNYVLPQDKQLSFHMNMKTCDCSIRDNNL